MCDYVAVRAAAGTELRLSVLGERLRALGLADNGPGSWLSGDATANMMVNAESASGLASRDNELVVSLDVTRWCPHSHRVAGFTDASTEQVQVRLLEAIARDLGWAVVDHDSPEY
jgi:hypothetical protein